MNVFRRKTRRNHVEQVGPVNRDVWRPVKLLAQRIERRPLQRTPILPASLVRGERADALAVEPCSKSQSAQDAHRVRAHVDAATDLGKFGGLLVDIYGKTCLPQRQRGGETADATADNGDPQRYFGPPRGDGFLVHRDLIGLSGLPSFRMPGSAAEEEPEPRREREPWRR